MGLLERFRLFSFYQLLNVIKKDNQELVIHVIEELSDDSGW